MPSDRVSATLQDGTIVDVNQPFCEAFNQSVNSLIGRKVWDIDQQLNPDELREIWATMEIGDRIELETEFQRDDGTEFPAEVHDTRLPVEDGDRFMVISRDITERKDQVKRWLQSSACRISSPLHALLSHSSQMTSPADSPMLHPSNRSLVSRPEPVYRLEKAFTTGFCGVVGIVRK